MEDIWRFTAKQWSPARANLYISDFLAALVDLASRERVGSLVLPEQQYYRLLVGSHLILYRASATRIDVIRILHQSMDLPRHLT